MAMHAPLVPPERPQRMVEMIAAFDWAATPLGPREQWPAELRFAADFCARAAVPVAIYWGPDHRLLYNDAWAPVLRERHPHALGRPAAEVWPDIWDLTRPNFDAVAASGEGMTVYEQMLPIRHGETVDETYWNYSLTPIADADGQILGIVNQGIEITKALLAERRHAFQVAVADRLRGLSDPQQVKQAATELLGRYLGASRVGYAEVDEASGTAKVHSDWTRDARTQSLGGQSAMIEAFGSEALAFLHTGQTLVLSDIRDLPIDRPETTQAWEAVGMRALITVPLVRENALKALLYVHEPHPRRWKRSEAAMARDLAERTWDAVERAQAEQRQRLLINELNHRVKNTLATVQAIAFQTLKGEVPLAEARSRFEARLMALSRAHGLLTAQSWEGASLGRVVADATEYLADAGRFEISGEEVWLAPRAALALALAFHELSTNAAKYGALSAEGGSVKIAWTVEEGTLAIRWKESGGPAVAAPAQRGFGSRLIERGLASDLGGRAELTFDADGVACTIIAPFGAVAAKGRPLG